MPERTFNASSLRTQRELKRMSRRELADAVGVGANAVARWEAGEAVPPPEKLPRIARALEADLDVLFPRPGLPDLTDLRCDAGMIRADTIVHLGTKSAMPLRAAETGKRPLSAPAEVALAAAYGVSLAELRAAQKRSFGHDVPAIAPRSSTPPPSTVAAKLAFLREELPLAPATDAELAEAGNSAFERPVLTAHVVRTLREGTQTASVETLDALALAYGVPPVYFRTRDPHIARLVVSARAVRDRYASTTAPQDQGELPAAARAELVAFISDMAAQMHDAVAGPAAD
ncbi:multiprotein-bridging factor 1 family protein [Streptomyces sp. NPDC053474]|uniref:multiprotein-bridging factor 1 family protein n=1 Tax=Streptomyces sp. NPDC053474 TaxID=3365704 RepID=UPI0037D93ECD